MERYPPDDNVEEAAEYQPEQGCYRPDHRVAGGTGGPSSDAKSFLSVAMA